MTAYVWQRWLLPELRAAAEPLGIKVVAVDGWENRGRPASTGGFDPQGPTTTHHTGSTTSKSNTIPTLRTLIVGRSDLPGPLVQTAVGYDGTIYVVAAGRCNHAGRVGKPGIVGMPLGADGNALSIGDEVDTNGNQPLPAEQRRSIALINAVVERHFGVDEKYAHRHEDISNTGKWDIGSLTTPELRHDAADMLEELDMPTPQEIADAVWNRPIKVGGKDVPARRVIGQLANQQAAIADTVAGLDDIEAKVTDAATKQQVRKLRDKLNAVLRAEAVDNEGTTP